MIASTLIYLKHSYKHFAISMVDRQNRPGARIGNVGVSSYEDANVDRRDRLRKLAMEHIDISKDPYFMRNHIGTY